jgi:hypothetical protein
MSDKLRRIPSQHHRDVLWTTGTVQICSQKGLLSGARPLVPQTNHYMHRQGR